MEVAATSGYVQAVAAATERAPAEMRKAEQRDASVEGIRMLVYARVELHVPSAGATQGTGDSDVNTPQIDKIRKCAKARKIHRKPSKS